MMHDEEKGNATHNDNDNGNGSSSATGDGERLKGLLKQLQGLQDLFKGRFSNGGNNGDHQGN